jgi:hypothetical protein
MAGKLQAQLNAITAISEFAGFKKIIQNYINIVFVTVFAAFMLLNANSIQQNPSGLLGVTAYDPAKIKKAFALPSIALISLISVIIFAPISYKIFSLSELSHSKVILLIILQLLYIVSIYLLSGLAVQTISFIQYKFLKISDQNMVVTINVLMAVLLVFFAIVLSRYEIIAKVLPTAFVVKMYSSFEQNNLGSIFINAIANILNIAVISMVCNLAQKFLSFSWADSLYQTPLTIISFSAKNISGYLILILNKFIRSTNNYLPLMGVSCLLIFGAVILKSIGNFEEYYYYYYSFTTIILVMTTGVFINNFNDYDINSVLRHFNGNISEYNRWFFLVITIITMLFQATNHLLILLIFNFELQTIWDTNFVFIALMVVVAMIFKNLFSDSKSSQFTHFFVGCAYLIVISATISGMVKINLFVTDHLAIKTNLSSILLGVLAAITIYPLQLLFIKLKNENAEV